MVSTVAPTDVESRLLSVLRMLSEQAIQLHGTPWAADRLGISERGIDAILWRKYWPADVTLHVATLLGVLTDAHVDRLARPLDNHE